MPVLLRLLTRTAVPPTARGTVVDSILYYKAEVLPSHMPVIRRLGLILSRQLFLASESHWQAQANSLVSLLRPGPPRCTGTVTATGSGGL
jgi:hypothetical protein